MYLSSVQAQISPLVNFLSRRAASSDALIITIIGMLICYIKVGYVNYALDFRVVPSI